MGGARGADQNGQDGAIVDTRRRRSMVTEEMPINAPDEGDVVRATRIAAAVAFIGGIVYVAVVFPGLMGDEPSHWANVIYYAQHLRMPRLGSPGTTYEATQPPLAYVIDAVVYRIFDPVSRSVAFYALRGVSVVELVFVIFLMGRILRRLVPSGVGVGVALMFMALNPMLLAMAGAIQNDMLSLLLGLAALVLVLERDGPDLSLADGAVIGAVAALGLITKETVWPLIVAVPVYWALRHGVRRTLPAAVTFVAAYVVLVGWWVGRNLDLYHSLTGKLGIAPVFRVHGLSGVWHVFENLLTYLWLPTEYYRSVIRAPLPLRGIVFLVTIAVGVLIVYRLIQLRAVAGKVRGRVRQGDPPTAAWTLVAVTGIVAVVGWVVLFTHVSGVVGRMAYMVWPLWIAMIAVVVGMVTTGRRALPIWVPMLITVVFLVAANGWVLASTFGLHPTPYRIMLS